MLKLYFNQQLIALTETSESLNNDSIQWPFFDSEIIEFMNSFEYDFSIIKQFI